MKKGLLTEDTEVLIFPFVAGTSKRAHWDKCPISQYVEQYPALQQCLNQILCEKKAFSVVVQVFLHFKNSLLCCVIDKQRYYIPSFKFGARALSARDL